MKVVLSITQIQYKYIKKITQINILNNKLTTANDGGETKLHKSSYQFHSNAIF